MEGCREEREIRSRRVRKERMQMEECREERDLKQERKERRNVCRRMERREQFEAGEGGK